jgi:hypothetical protein
VHAVTALCPAGQKAPTVQAICEAEDEPAGQYEPAAHGPDTVDKPSVLQNEPTVHVVGALACAGQNAPSGHA